MTPREIDALVGNHIMNGEYTVIFTPSSSIADAWLVVEKLTNKERPRFQISMTETYNDKPKWLAEFDLDRPFKRAWATADTAPMAIAKAALKAKGVEV